MSQPKSPRFDAECDVAAIVYAPGDDPDLLLAEFTAELSATGFDALGIVQRRRPEQHDGKPLPDLLIVPSGMFVSDTHEATAERCPHDSCRTMLSNAEAWLQEAVRRRPDLLVINRFGSAERAGGGLLGVLAEAVEADIPVLVAVPQALFEDWLRFTDGLAIKLDCRRASLDRWWQALGRAPVFPFRAGGFCELFK